MMRRPVRVVTVALSTLLASGFAAGLSAGPVSASSAPPTVSVGCQGVDCWSQLGLTVNGHAVTSTASGNSLLSSVPPPPCWYTSFATAAGMKQFVDQQMQSPGAAADGVPQTFSSIQSTVNSEAKSNAPGEWYTLTEPTPPAQDSVSCIQGLMAAHGGSYYLWLPPNAPVPQPHIAPQDLALLALSQVTLPAPDVTVNPQNKTYVGLPTFVAAHAVQPVQATAKLGNQTVTVTATPTGLAISAPQPQAYENGPQGNCLPQGSTASQATMNAAGAGHKPDCGFVFSAPTSAPITITAQETWHATWAGEGLVNQPVPQQPTPTAANPVPVTVNEIQAVNGAPPG